MTAETAPTTAFPTRRFSTASARCGATASTRWRWGWPIRRTGRPSGRTRAAYLDRFGLTAEEKEAVLARDWREMVRLGGNLFFILKISAVDPVRITEIGAHQAGMDHEAFLRDRLGKK